MFTTADQQGKDLEHGKRSKDSNQFKDYKPGAIICECHGNLAETS